jgi:hypothetical protein
LRASRSGRTRWTLHRLVDDVLRWRGCPRTFGFVGIVFVVAQADHVVAGVLVIGSDSVSDVLFVRHADGGI